MTDQTIEHRRARRPLSEWSEPAGRTAPGRAASGRKAPGRTAPAPSRPRQPRPQPARDPVSLRRLAAAIPTAGGSAVPALAPDRRPEKEPDKRESRRHLRVVGPRQRSSAARRRQAGALVIIGSLALLVVAFGLVYLHVLSAQKQFALDRLTTREQAAQSTYQGLRTVVEADNSPMRIMAEAERLHMVEPAQITTVPAVAGGTVTPGADPAVTSGSTAPGGVANWSQTKPDLAGAP